jgi:hypothetical protein
MSSAVLRRLAAMPAEELRFRLGCELRKTASRLRIRVSARGWERSDLAGVIAHESGGTSAWPSVVAALKEGDFRTAHEALAGHFRVRRSAFPLNAHETAARAGVINDAWPGAAADASARAARLLEGQYDLLGYTGLQLGVLPDWHHDPVHDRRPPLIFWANVPFLEPAAGDHKIIWELNRHQHWLGLGRAHALTGDRRCYARFTSQLASWLAANPPLIGTNWASMLELAFRTIAWMWALELFTGSAGPEDEEPWLVDLLLALDRQLTHIEHNLSHYYSPNTHLTGEALALYIGGLCFPELKASARRVTLGRNVLLREASRQIRRDGGHAELSAHYHRYSTDFYLLATTVARRAGDSAAATFSEASARQARYLRHLADDRGIRPQIGDDDGGQLLPMCGRAVEDCADTLATAAVLLDDPSLATGPAPEETIWICGPAALGLIPAADAAGSIALDASGYYISRSAGGDRLIFDAGPHGFLNGGHAHADALSCILSVGGRDVLIDPGTASYTMHPALRDRFRSAMMHNTVVVDGRSSSEPRGAFHWQSCADSHARLWRSSERYDYVEGSHDGYAPRRHTRAILAVHGLGWWIVDHLIDTTGATTPSLLEHHWHLHPTWRPALVSASICRLVGPGTTLAIASSAPLTLLEEGHPLAVRSPIYGRIERSPVLRATTRSVTPVTVATFIPAAPEMVEGLAIETLPIDHPPAPDWHAAAFRAIWPGGTTTILTSTELAANAKPTPLPSWGTCAVQTNGRVLARIESAGGRQETIRISTDDPDEGRDAG